MATDRYKKDPVLNYGAQFGTARATNIIRSAIASGRLTFKSSLLHGFERLDTLSGVYYGDGRYWWVLAAASNIGWGLQVPPGTVINVPRIADVLQLLA